MKMQPALGTRNANTPSMGRRPSAQHMANSKPPAEECTTLMLRNLPRKCTEQDVICELQKHVGLASINYLYVPWDTARSMNNGHAFVNCVTASSARILAYGLDGSRWDYGPVSRVTRACVAITQGLAANMERYLENLHARMARQDAATSKRQHCEPRHPLVFRNGACIRFAEAIDVCRPFYLSLALELGIFQHSESRAAMLEEQSSPCQVGRGPPGSVPRPGVDRPEALRPNVCFRYPRWQPMTTPLSEIFADDAADHNRDAPRGAEMPVPSFLASTAGHKWQSL